MIPGEMISCFFIRDFQVHFLPECSKRICFFLNKNLKMNPGGCNLDRNQLKKESLNEN